MVARSYQELLFFCLCASLLVAFVDEGCRGAGRLLGPAWVLLVDLGGGAGGGGENPKPLHPKLNKP